MLQLPKAVLWIYALREICLFTYVHDLGACARTHTHINEGILWELLELILKLEDE